MTNRRGLLIFPGALGDLICLVPAIRELASHHPSIRFELMARAELADFAVRRMPISTSYSIDGREVALLFTDEGEKAELARKFFGQFDRIDCFFAADNRQFCSSLQNAAHGPVFFYPFRPPGDGHIAECYLRAIGASGSVAPDSSILVLPEDEYRARETLDQFGYQSESFVLMLPGSGSPKKNWPIENFVSLASRVQLTIPVLTVLGPAEIELECFFRKDRSLPIMKDLQLGELAALAGLARGFIGNDSGVSHLAAAAGAPGVVIFGPTEPERWRPLGDVQIIHKNPLKCLTVEEVWPAIAAMIQRTTS